MKFDVRTACICIYAEESALLEAGINFIIFNDTIMFFIIGRRQCRNATLYVTHNPCRQCSKKIIQSGIKRIIYTHEYPASLQSIHQLFDEANIELDKQKIESIALLRLNR